MKAKIFSSFFLILGRKYFIIFMNISMIFWPSKIGNIYILFFRIFISCFINLYRENKEGKNKCRKKMRKLGKNKRKDKADSTWNGNKSDYIVCKFCVSKGDKVWKLSKCVRNWYLHSWNSFHNLQNKLINSKIFLESLVLSERQIIGITI